MDNSGSGTTTPDTPVTPPVSGGDFVDAPEQDVAYKFGVYLPPLSNQSYYVDGTNGEKYLNTTTDVAAAVDVYYTKSGSGYVIYTIKDDIMYFIDILPRDNEPEKVRVVYKTAGAQNPTIYQMNTEYKYLTTTVNGVEYTLGTYTNNGKTYETLSASESSYLSDPSVIGVTQFPAWFMTGEGNQGGTTTPDEPVTPPVTGNGYQQVTSLSEITSGGTFVVAALYEGEYKVLDTTFAKKPTAISGGTGTLTVANLPAWIFAAAESGVSISSSGKYLTYGGTGTDISNATSASGWTIEAGEAAGTFRIRIGERYICYQYTDKNDGSTIRNRFGMYKFPQSTGVYEFDLYLFKVV